MCRKFLLLMLWALLPFGAWGTASSNSLLPVESLSGPWDACDLDAPTNFQVWAVGGTWVHLIWMPSVPAVDHLVKVFRASDNMLIQQATISPTMPNAVIINGLQEGETYYATVCAICPDGTESTKFASTPDWDTVIGDLIVAGFSNSCGNSSCGIRNPGEFCQFPLDGSSTYFKIRPHAGANPTCQFLLQKVNVNGEPRLRCRVNPNNGPFTFWLDGQPANQQGAVQGESFEVKLENVPVAAFRLSENYATLPAVGHITWTMENTGFDILRLYYVPCGNGGGGGNGGGNGGGGGFGGGAPLSPSNLAIWPEEETLVAETQLAVVSPNPFIDHLDVYLTRFATNSVNLQLFNLAGQKVLDQQLAGGQDQYHLPTGTLANGFYLLRVEADGRVQTLKVVKSE